ncbi:MAG: HAMP domain-containing protein [Elusimicrobium sp.]|jgi:signal transduction histidine kinase|nr:HAMP domain-containing protein [Elusimicrobium sp.]
MPVKSKSLFYAIVKVLLLAALIPAAVFSFYMMEMDSRIIKQELIDKQSFMNITVQSSVRSYLGRKRGMLRSFLSLYEIFANNRQGIAKKDLATMLKVYPDILAIGFIDEDGVIKASEGSLALSTDRSGELNAVKYLCINKGEDYIGVIKDDGAARSMIIAVPYKVKNAVKGALVVRLNISEMFENISDNFVGDVFYGLFTPDGKVLASSQPVTEDIKNAFMKMQGKDSREFKFSDGKKYIVTASVIGATGWIVYVQSPSVPRSALFFKNYHALTVAGIMIIFVIIFVLVLSKVAIKPVVEPVKMLEEAAYKISRGKFDSLPKPEQMSDNEVGDLGRTFIKMADSLKTQTEQIAKAKEELADENTVLEKRVDERTRELSHATNALVKKERLAAIGEMASIISHEIRNPLAVISNSAKLIKALSSSGNPKLEKQFNIIESEVRQANRIVEEVLGYARDRKQILSDVGINSYIKDILSVQPLPEKIKVEAVYDAVDAAVRIDLEEMKQAVINLINNAVDVMSGSGTLGIGTKVGKKVVCFYVCDDGAGMGADTLMKIFTPFFTTKARGTGLGLAVVKKAVANNRGKLFVESAKGKGSKFTIFLRKAQNGKTSQNINS